MVRRQCILSTHTQRLPHAESSKKEPKTLFAAQDKTASQHIVFFRSTPRMTLSIGYHGIKQYLRPEGRFTCCHIAFVHSALLPAHFSAARTKNRRFLCERQRNTLHYLLVAPKNRVNVALRRFCAPLVDIRHQHTST